MNASNPIDRIFSNPTFLEEPHTSYYRECDDPYLNFERIRDQRLWAALYARRASQALQSNPNEQRTSNPIQQ